MTAQGATTPTRLQLGTSRLEKLTEPALRVFLSPSWLHLGEPERAPDPAASRIIEHWRRHGAAATAAASARRLKSMLSMRPSPADLGRTIAECPDVRFEEFFFTKDDVLPYPDGSFRFIYSEHFLEHLFLDEALALLHEAKRLLGPDGVLRVVVPDADLRSYARPEVVGYPGPALDWSHPDKHKTRWSVYSLVTVLEMAGFRSIPLEYCDRNGNFKSRPPASRSSRYPIGVDADVVFDLSYVLRRPSLIVDGLC